MNILAFGRAFARACNDMTSHTEELCRLDAYIGDGDHGVTVERGFKAAIEALTQKQTPQELFFAIGESMSDAMGGAIGPLYGMFWRGVGKALRDEDITPQSVGKAWRQGCDAVMRVGKAQPGEKTIVDAMLPSVEAAEPAESLSETLTAMAQAANAGAQETVGMQASKGRARFLGERAMGRMDPGAYSYALFLEHLAQEVAQEEHDGNLL